MSDVDFLKRLNQRILTDLSVREAMVAEREEQANRTLKECFAEREAIGTQRRALEQVEALQINALQFGPPPADLDVAERAAAPVLRPPIHRTDDSLERKPKARVGDQRYIMLTAVREAGFMSMDDIVEQTGYSLKRVKDQIRADHPEFLADFQTPDGSGGFLTSYELTPDGVNLLQRFEDYRRSKNIPLPRLGDSSSDQDDDLALENTSDAIGAKSEEDHSATTEGPQEEPPVQSAEHSPNADPSYYLT